MGSVTRPVVERESKCSGSPTQLPFNLARLTGMRCASYKANELTPAANSWLTVALDIAVRRYGHSAAPPNHLVGLAEPSCTCSQLSVHHQQWLLSLPSFIMYFVNSTIENWNDFFSSCES